MGPLALSPHFLQAQPDDRLVALAREGHATAFEALVRRYRKELLAYCRRLQPRSGSAEDALQQTLLQAWRALSAGAEIRDVRPWLYRIAHNVTVNQLRIAVSVPQDLSEAAGAQEVHQLVEQRLQARAALAGIASLPALQRDVFISTALEGATHEQMASSLGLSSGAIRGLIYRARATLRSAAAALIPSPTLQWALRRAETRAGPAPAVSETLAGGAGASVAAAIGKGGAVLALAGALAGAGGVIVTHASNRHRHEARSGGPAAGAQAHSPVARFRVAADVLGTGFAPGAASTRSRNDRHMGQAASRATGERGRDSGSFAEDHRGSSSGSAGDHGKRSPGGSDRGSPRGASGSSDGGPAAGATIVSSGDGGSGSSPGGPSGGSDGGSSSSSSTSTSTGSGSDAGTSGGVSSSGDQASTVGTTSDGSSGSDAGLSSITDSSSGSGDTTTTATTGQ